MCEKHVKQFKSKYTITYFLDEIDRSKNRGLKSLIVFAPYDSPAFVEAVRANRVECELRDREFIANLIAEEGKKAYLYISW